MRVIGADLSLTSTGLALINNGHFEATANFKSKGKRGDGYPEWCRRIEAMSTDVTRKLNLWWVLEAVDLLVIESPSHGSTFGNPHERAGLWWDVYRWAFDKEIPVATVAPATRAKYLTGSGRSDKKVVLAHAIERYVQLDTPRITNDDIADAVGLADMGARWLGEPLVPDELMPAANMESMKGAKWPSKASAPTS